MPVPEEKSEAVVCKHCGLFVAGTAGVKYIEGKYTEFTDPLYCGNCVLLDPEQRTADKARIIELNTKAEAMIAEAQKLISGAKEIRSSAITTKAVPSLSKQQIDSRVDELLSEKKSATANEPRKVSDEEIEKAKSDWAASQKASGE